MAKPIKDTPVLTGDDAVKFTLDSLHVEPAKQAFDFFSSIATCKL